MSLVKFTKANPCPACGGWFHAGSSGEACAGGVPEGDPTTIYCSVRPNSYPSTSGRTWRYLLDGPYEFAPEQRAGRRAHHPIPEGWQRTAVYAYEAEEFGELVTKFYVARFESPDGTPDSEGRTKTFRPVKSRRGPVCGLPPWQRVPYRLPDLQRAVREGRPVFVCEGEKDCDNGAARFPEAAFTCNPGGGHTWLTLDAVRAEIARLRPGVQHDERVTQIYDGAVKVAADALDRASRAEGDDALRELQAGIAALRLARDASAMGGAPVNPSAQDADRAAGDAGLEKRLRSLVKQLRKAKGDGDGAEVHGDAG